MSDSLWPHELQHTRPPYPSPTPRVHSNSHYSAIKRNAFESVLMKWMNLEPIIQSEVKSKNKYCILMRAYRIYKDGTGDPTWGCKEQTFGLSGRRWGWDDLREQPWNMYITICKINDQCKFSAWSMELKAGAWGQPRGTGWGGRWLEGFRMEGYMHTCGQFMLMYDLNHHSIVK